LPANAVEAGTRTEKIVGHVAGAGKGLAGVLVSDGCRVVRTDGEGRYHLATGPDSGPFVFVTNPAGFWTEAFYVPVTKAVTAGRADFSLDRVGQPDRFDFAFITDLHLDNGKIGIRKFQMSLREINFLQPRPAFIWSQGDICLQGHAGEVYADCLKRAKMPVRTGPGNHEMMLEHKNPRDDFHRLFGPTYYSFDWAGIHCIVLDGNKPIPGGKDWKAVHGAVEGSELAWLRADLAAQPKGRPIIVGIHIPIVTTYPERRKHSPPDAPYWEVTNRDVLTGLFASHGVRLVLQGHMHENERAWVKGVEYVASISISGSWYQSGEGMERGVDGSPRGYRIVSVDGARITHCYRSSCESRVDRQGEWCGLDKPFSLGTQAALIFNCYDAPNGSTAEARIGQGGWRPMPAFAAMDKKNELAMPHHFRLVADTKALGPGRHEVVARVRWPDGTVVTEQGEFTVADNPR
jgi:UDP-2,3-diacylglucosamine pyrophosphatase LpxH